MNIKVNKGKAKSSKVISLSGNLDIDHAEKLKDTILSCSESKVNIKTKDVTNVDVSFLQVLVAAKQSFGLEKRDLIIDMDLPAELKELVDKSGIFETL